MLIYSDELVKHGVPLYQYAVPFDPPDHSLIMKAMIWCSNSFGPDGLSRTDELSLFRLNQMCWTCINKVFYFNDLLEATLFKLRWGLDKEEPRRRRILRGS